jgi:hypothetical protein
MIRLVFRTLRKLSLNFRARARFEFFPKDFSTAANAFPGVMRRSIGNMAFGNECREALKRGLHRPEDAGSFWEEPVKSGGSQTRYDAPVSEK